MNADGNLIPDTNPPADSGYGEYDDLYDAISQLEPQQQKLIRKVFFEGVSQSEIAAEEGVDKSAVSKRMARIFARLKKSLEKKK